MYKVSLFIYTRQGSSIEYANVGWYPFRENDGRVVLEEEGRCGDGCDDGLVCRQVIKG